MKRILIYFGDEQQKQPIVEQVLKDMHADYRILQDADLNQCVANLMGLPGFDEIPDAKPAHHSIDLMLFEDASDEEIQKVNECLQAKGTAMQRKAMLTKHNKDWTFHDLLSEIEREHTYFQTMDAIRTLLVQSSELVIEAYTPASWKSYENSTGPMKPCPPQKSCLSRQNKAVRKRKSAWKRMSYRNPDIKMVNG